MFAGFIISHDPDGSIHQTYMQGTGPGKCVYKRVDQETSLNITFLSKKSLNFLAL